MTEAGWTAEPKEEGWHWWRKPSDGLTIPYVVKVQKASSGWFVLWQHDWNYAEVLGGEFLGPLSPTDRQQGRVEGLREYREVVARELQLDHSNHPTRFKASIIEALDKADFEVSKQAAQDEKGVGE